VRFYFQVVLEGVKQTLALCSLYSPANEHIREHSNGALIVCTYEGEGKLVVIQAKSIHSVVAMVPFGDQRNREFFLVEKFALGVIDTGDTVDE